MVVTCAIEFDNNSYGTYFAGQVMTGKVTLQADMPKQVKAIVLKISGCADTSWTESSTSTTSDANGRSSTQTQTTHYRGHEDYIKSKTYLLSSNENQSAVIEPGIHTYTFACLLPNTCPSSFEGIYGYIRYLTRVELVRPWKFNQNFTRGFTVLKMTDLNYDSPLLRVPSKSEAQKVFCCGPCKTQPLEVHVSLPQSGYVPGQAIPVSVLISNETKIKVEELKIELVMLVCYYSQTPSTRTKNQRIPVLKLKGDGVPVHCKKQFNYTLIVPATPPTCFNLCRIIQIAYQVEVVTKVKGWHADQVICVPVTIGNVPLLGVIQKQPMASADNFVPNGSGVMNRSFVANEESGDAGDAGEKKSTEANQVQSTVQEDPTEINNGAATSSVITPAPPNPWDADASIPPPSYESALHIKPAKLNLDEGQEYGETEFAPRYPVFKVPSPSASGKDEVDGVATSGVSPAQNSTWL
ncbi:PREDICTED: arrestin domain-containing protein 17-like isoform X2 [Bactrocera latifrons]|uniref:Arrestin domain-containing protein 3 n=1 Tax=Bactrocera latifrons TaxID=174628 RepID=A0A0K8UC16_BACLA|nr:PREDICTED: arrestin domain-containing protein 17-like isoform X2 [Bactrocera latifrons]